MRQILLLLGKLLDIARGILEREQAATARQRNRIVKLALPTFAGAIDALRARFRRAFRKGYLTERETIGR
jgi:hypothetical protein